MTSLKSVITVRFHKIYVLIFYHKQVDKYAHMIIRRKFRSHKAPKFRFANDAQHGKLPI